MVARENATSGQTDALRKRVEELELRHRQFLEFTDGPWTGDLLGFAAQPTQKFVNLYLLKEVTPMVGFFTKGVVDLRIRFTPDDEAHLAASRATVASATNMLEKMKASARVQELEMQKERARRAADYAKKIDQWPELKYRFQRNSLYLYLREKYHNTTDQQFTAWFNQWMKDSGMATAEAAGRERPASRQRDAAVNCSAGRNRAGWPRSHPGSHAAPASRGQPARAGQGRSGTRRALSNAYEDMERRRAAATQRNLDRARDMFRAANVGLATEKLKEDPRQQQYLLALRYLAIPRSVPQLKTAIYRVATTQPTGDPMVDKNAEYIFRYATTLNVDPTLYFPDAAGAGANPGAAANSSSGAAELAGQYYMKHSYLVATDAKSAAASGVADGIPLLPGISELFTQLLTEHSKEVENGQGLIVLSSALANDMADMTDAAPSVFMHLPSVKHQKITWTPGKEGPLGATSADGKQRYLMAQTVGYVSTPEELKGEEIWYVAERFPMDTVNEYGPLPTLNPVFKVIRQESGAFSGDCNYSIRVLGILQETKANISGTIDPKTKKVQLQLSGHFQRSYMQQGLEGDTVDFSGKLVGAIDGLQLGANAALVNAAGDKGSGSVHTVFNYLNNKPPSSLPKDMADKVLANTPNARDIIASIWYLVPVADAPAGSKLPRPWKGKWRCAVGEFDLDQCANCVAGTAHLAGDMVGPVIGNGDATMLNFDCYDGNQHAASGTVSLTKDGAYAGYFLSGLHQKTAITLTR